MDAASVEEVNLNGLQQEWDLCGHSEAAGNPLGRKLYAVIKPKFIDINVRSRGGYKNNCCVPKAERVYLYHWPDFNL